MLPVARLHRVELLNDLRLRQWLLFLSNRFSLLPHRWSQRNSFKTSRSACTTKQLVDTCIALRIAIEHTVYLISLKSFLPQDFVKINRSDHEEWDWTYSFNTSSGAATKENIYSAENGPPLWSSGQSFWLQIHRSRVRFPALPDFLISRGSGTGSTQPREDSCGAAWMK
jgi:hypothetical protein